MHLFSYVIIFILLVANTSVFGAANTPSLSNPNLTKVTENIYALIGDMDVPNETNGGFICNSVFIITQQGVVVIDPGGSLQVGEMILKQIRKLTSKPITHVFNTHHHADHWMGNQAFSNLSPAPKIMGQYYMKDKAEEIGERWLGILEKMTKGKNQGTQVVLPSEVLEGNEKMQIGGLTFQFYHPAHAHTQGDLAVYIPEEKVLIAGDILFYLRTPGFQDASPSGNAQALESLNKLEFNQVIPGHGPVTDKSGIKYMLEYVQLLHNEVKKYYEQGLSDFEMKERIDVGKYRQMSGFEGRFGINVNRMFLEIEAQEFAED